MKQLLKLFLPLTVISSLIMVMQCANPVDEPPLRWRTKVQIPISNKEFLLKNELGNLFNWDSMEILDRHPAVSDSGDTMLFSYERFSTDTFVTHEDSLDNSRFVVSIGPIPLRGVPLIQRSGTLPSTARTFSIPIPVKLDSIYHITFTTAPTNKIPIVVTNNSSASVLSNVIVNAGTLGADTLGSIGPSGVDTAWLPVSGKQCDSIVTLTLSGVKSAGAATVGFTMDLNGLTASILTADDHLVQFSRTVFHAYDITDTLDIDYIDFIAGDFKYSITNYTSIPVTVDGEHYHLWRSDFCEMNNVTRAEDLFSTTKTDSFSYYYGKLNGEGSLINDSIVRPIRIPVAAYSQQKFQDRSLGNNRLFTSWDSTTNKAVTNVKYTVSTPSPEGKRLTLASTDSVVFTIQGTLVKFKEFLCTSRMEYVRAGDTQKVFIDVPWPQSSQDSLRGRFVLSNVTGDIFIKPYMPENAFIDSMAIEFIVFSPESLSVQDTGYTMLTNVNKDSTFKRSINITDVTNLFLDTLFVTAKMRIPKNTRMHIQNDLVARDPDYARYIGRMRTIFTTSYFLNTALDWTILDTVNMDLGSGKFKVPDELRYVRKLDQKTASFHLDVTNQSNLNMYLYALLAPRSRMKALDSLDGNQFTYLLNHPDSASSLGFINFFGSQGTYIPRRDSIASDTISWNQIALDSITSSDSCSWRWQLRFVPNSRDVLKDTDYLRIHSWLNIEGINNMDSLMMW